LNVKCCLAILERCRLECPYQDFISPPAEAEPENCPLEVEKNGRHP